MHKNGYSLVSEYLSESQCREFIGFYERPELFRKTVSMERYRFGLGEYKYFDYPLPEPIQFLRENLYPPLAEVANEWMFRLNIDTKFPLQYDKLQKLCKENEQTKPTALVLKYGKGGFNTLHQDLYGEVYFPIQAVFFLNQQGDYSGGEFVLTESTPRAQSKAIVLRPDQGDLLFITTNFRPIKGKKGYYKVQMKHGVSEVHCGERNTLGIIFHDAKS